MAIKESPSDTFRAILDKFKVDYVQEYKFDKSRAFRLDFALVERKICFEIDGGIWTNGRHTRPIGSQGDCVKQWLAVDQGWKYYRIPAPWLKHDKFKHNPKPYMIYYQDIVEFVGKLGKSA